MKDFIGQDLSAGDIVAKAERSSTIAFLELRVIQRIEDGKIYLQRPDSYEQVSEDEYGYVPNLKRNSVPCDPEKLVKLHKDVLA